MKGRRTTINPITYINDKTIEFYAELVSEGSWGSRSLGMAKSTMEFIPSERANHYILEWDSEVGFEHIGLITVQENGKEVLEDYDGIMGWLPEEAIELIRKQGIEVGLEFEP